MGETTAVIAPETVACQICLKEIPRSVAESAEAVEYVYYFCGPECYTEWRREERRETPARQLKA
jgi:YHS domain-containing protein